MPANNKLFTPEQEAWFRENFYGKADKVMAHELKEKFGLEIKPDNLKAWRRRHGLKNGRSGLYVLGQEARNKGKPAYFNSPEAEERSAACRFKPGQKPPNTAQIGERRKLADGYIWVKINDKPRPKKKKENWCQEHILVWEKAHGPIPDGYCIMHLNRDKTDNRLENLICIKRKLVPYMRRSNMFSVDPDLLQSNLLMAEISAKVYEKKGKAYQRKPKAEHKKTGPKKGKQKT